MIICAAIISQCGEIFCSNLLPFELRADIDKYGTEFLDELEANSVDKDLPFIEKKDYRFLYKQTGDLYWVLTTRVDSDLYSDITLLGKFVCAIMECGTASETNTGTLTDEQRDLFYRHIWRPWDEDKSCFMCNSCLTLEQWELEFEARLRFLISIRNGQLDEESVRYFEGLISEAWIISIKLFPRWKSGAISEDEECPTSSDSESLGSLDEMKDQSINEDTLIDCCRMKCKLEDIRIMLTRFQDPYLRLFVRRDLLMGTIYDQSNDGVSAPNISQLEDSVSESY